MNRRPPRRADIGSGAPVLSLPRDAWALRGACTVPSSAPAEDAAAMWDAFDEPTVDAARLAMVRGICAACPVLAECRKFGAGQRFGFYGGLTPEERAARARGDGRPHEQLVEEASVLEQARAVGAVERQTHGGTRRGSSWAAARADALAAVSERREA